MTQLLNSGFMINNILQRSAFLNLKLTLASFRWLNLLSVAEVVSSSGGLFCGLLVYMSQLAPFVLVLQIILPVLIFCIKYFIKYSEVFCLPNGIQTDTYSLQKYYKGSDPYTGYRHNDIIFFLNSVYQRYIQILFQAYYNTVDKHPDFLIK